MSGLHTACNYLKHLLITNHAEELISSYRACKGTCNAIYRRNSFANLHSEFRKPVRCTTNCMGQTEAMSLRTTRDTLSCLMLSFECPQCFFRLSLERQHILLCSQSFTGNPGAGAGKVQRVL